MAVDGPGAKPPLRRLPLDKPAPGLGIAEAAGGLGSVPRCAVCGGPKWLPADGVWRCGKCDT